MNSQDPPKRDQVHDESSRDLHYTDACNFQPNQTRHLNWVTHKTLLRPILDAFTANLHRTWSMSVLPQGIMHTAVIHDLLFTQAIFNVLGRPFFEATDTKETLGNVAAEFDRLDAIEPAPNERPGVTNQTVHLIHYHKKKLIPSLHSGFMALLGAQVINTLTAFEALSEDLWIAAVNARPKRLGSKESVIKKWKPQITMFQKFDFNLKNHMGDLISDQIHWDSFKEMREAYKLAFEDESISEVFDLSDLSVVNATRNVLVHKAGIADKMYVDDLKVKHYFPTVEEGQPVPLDGFKVCCLTIATINSAEALIRGVDRWLEEHQESKKGGEGGDPESPTAPPQGE